MGFLSKRSTADAVVETMENLLINRGNIFKAYCTLLDLSKFSETVDHQILMLRLQNTNLLEKILACLKIICMIESSTFQSEVTTQLKNILCGIPRGTVIRRLLLFSYINDLTDVPEKIRLCYLPTELTYSRSLFKKLQSDMCKASKWTEENKLTLYKAKTHIERDVLKSSKFANI